MKLNTVLRLNIADVKFLKYKLFRHLLVLVVQQTYTVQELVFGENYLDK